MKFIKLKYKIIIVWFLAITSLFALYSNIITNPNSYIFQSEGDASKNYYTYKYYIDKNNSWTQFEGMNYPYGESIIFTDSQPGLSFFIKAASKVFPNIKDFDIGIMNYMILISFLISIFLFYKILRLFEVHFLVALIGAMCITYLSPQFGRLYGHYSLSYMVFYPLTIYFLIKNKNLRKSNIILLISTTFAFFIHPYIGISIFLIIILTKITEMLFTNESKKEKLYSIIIQAIIPISIFFISSIIIDNHTNRSTNPYGLYNYHSTISSIFSPSFSPFKDLYSYFINTEKQQFESQSYIGILSISFIIYILIFSVIKLFYHKIKIIDKKLINILIPSLVLLIFSFGIPHVYLFPKLQEILPFLKQFRALGRFAWFFYYIINISAIVSFYFLFLKYKKTIIAPIIIILFSVIFIAESFSYQLKIAQNIGKEKNPFISNKYSSLIKDINPSTYQAIVPLPFFHIGSEEITIEGSIESRNNTMLLSYYLNLPIIGNFGSRTSMDETIKSFSIFLPNFYKKEIKYDLKNEKSFLIIKTNNTIHPSEEYLLNQSTLISKNKDISLYTISYKKIFEYKKHQEKIIKRYFDLKNNSDFTTSDSSKLYKYYSFSDKNNTFFNFEKGCARIDNSKPKTLLTIKSNKFSPNKKYYLSVWVYNKELSIRNRIILLDEINTITNKSNQILQKNGKTSRFIYKNWTLYEFYFQPKSDSVNYKLYFPSIKRSVSKYTYIDDLLIREVDLDVYKKIRFDNKINLYYNNNLIEITGELLDQFNYDSEVKEIIKKITNNKQWYNSIKRQAKERNIPIDSMLERNAVWHLKNK